MNSDRQLTEAYSHEISHLLEQVRLLDHKVAIIKHASAQVGGVNWGHVGDLQHANKQLEALLKFLEG